MLGPWQWCATPSAAFKALDDSHSNSSLQQVKLTLLGFTGANLLAVPLWLPGTYSLFWGWPVQSEALAPCC